MARLRVRLSGRATRRPHYRPRIPAVERIKFLDRGCHSSGLRDASVLAAKDVVVVGGGAWRTTSSISAFDTRPTE